MQESVLPMQCGDGWDATCPVCGMDVAATGAITAEHGGMPYHFCSSDCRQAFLGNPNGYITMQRRRLQEHAHELELVRKETLECLSRAAEFKENETGRHTARIGAYSHHLALICGLPVDIASLVRETAPMHDVGKIGVPEHILCKPGALDRAEWQVIRKHPEMGAQIIGNNLRSEMMRMAARIAISHHEKWDGSGYPYCLRHESIPVEGRIVAISDVFDALISRRPYKPAWPPDKVRTLIREEGGSHFDPEMAEIFVQHFSDFEDIYAQLSDPVPSSS